MQDSWRHSYLHCEALHRERYVKWQGVDHNFHTLVCASLVGMIHSLEFKRLISPRILLLRLKDKEEPMNIDNDGIARHLLVLTDVWR